METLGGDVWDAEEAHLNNRNLSCLTPEIPSCPITVKLFLQENHSLTMIPPSFFEHMPTLQVLDLSRTSIQSLPPSISKLSLLEEFILQECSLLMELPPEIGALKNLKLFDLEGTEIMYLPKEMGNLENLEFLMVSLCAYADEYKERHGIENIIPRLTISKLIKLKELSISVSPDAYWWEVEVLEAILEELSLLPYLKTLRLYLPTAKELQNFLCLQNCERPIYSSLWNFRLIIGHSEQLTSCLPYDLLENFEKLEKCLKYINGEGNTDDIAELIKNARALFLCRHWTIEKLSIFDISSLKYCLLVECNEMLTIVNGDELFGDKSIRHNNGEKVVFGSIEYLAIHSMKKLQSIWRGSVARDSLSCLRIIALHTCPELTTIFTESMLDSLQNLTEVIVEDCPKVNSLVSLGSTPWRYGALLRNLRRLLLLDLPELVSISSGVCIAPRLDTLLIFNCLKLDYLSVMELPRDVKEIKGEVEWWDALKYGQSMWWSAFVPLKRDGDLMDQLAEDTNSLKCFHKLKTSPYPEMISSEGHDSSSAGTGTEAFRKLTEPPQQAIDIILSWGSTAENKMFVFDANRKEIDGYLKAVDEIQSSMNSAAVSDGPSKVKTTIRLAMSRLKDEFHNILQVEAKSKKHNSPLNLGSSTYQMNMPQGASSNYEVYKDDDYVKSITMSFEVINDLRSIAERTNSAGYIDDCVDAYICVRKSQMFGIFQRLKIQELSRYNVRKLEWVVLESMFDVWIKSANICFKHLFASEKQLCEQIFWGLGNCTDNVCFMEIVRNCANHLFNIAEALSSIRPSPETLFRILDLYETLSGILPQISKLFHTQTSEFFGTKAATRMLSKLADAVKEILSEFEKALYDQQSLVIFVGSIHPLPRYVMNYLDKLCDHKQTLTELSLSKLPSMDGAGLSLEIVEFKGRSELSCHVVWIIMTLVSNLESKAKLCEDDSAGRFFAMNNVHYIVQKIKGRSELMELVGDDYFSKLIRKLDQAKADYLMLALEKMREMRDY